MKAFSSIVVTAALLASAAGGGTISGYVREAGSEESMPYVSVYIDGLRIGAMTNVAGYYVITGVPPGPLTLIASLVGYNEYRSKVEVGETPIIQNIRLAPRAIELQSVQVTAERVQAPSLEIIPSRETLRGVDLKIAPAAVEADPIRTLQTLPGVLQLSDFNTGLYVRGGTPDQNLILLDGSELYNVSHFFGLFSTFPTDAIKSTELLLGGYPAQYGGRLSSVLNVTTDEGNKEAFHGSSGISMLSARGTLQGPIGKGSYLVSARRTYLEPIFAAAGLDGFGYYFYDFQGKVHQIVSHNDQIAFAGYLGSDDLTYANDYVDLGVKWGNQSLSFAWTHLYSSTLYSHYQMNLSQFQSTTKAQVEDLGYVDTNKLSDFDVSGDVTWFANDRNTIETGLHVKRQNLSLWQEIGSQRYQAFDIVAYEPAVYVQDSWRPRPYVTVQPGLRASYYAGTNNGSSLADAVTYGDLEPRLSLRFQVGKNTFLKFAIGRYTQYIFRVPREMQGISAFSDIWFTCDSSAAPQHAWHYILGLETKFKKDVDFTAETYFKQYQGLAEFNTSNFAPQSAGDALRRGKGFTFGTDVLLRKRAGRHTGWIGYSLSWTLKKIDGLNVGRDDNVLYWYYPKYDQRHSLNAVYSFQWTRHWSVNARYAFSSGQGYTKVLGREVIVGPILRLDPMYRDNLNASRMPYYSRLDLGIRGAFHGWGAKWMPYLQIVNVLNRKNEFNRYFDNGDPTENPPAFAQEKSIPELPFLPTIGLDMEF